MHKALLSSQVMGLQKLLQVIRHIYGPSKSVTSKLLEPYSWVQVDTLLQVISNELLSACMTMLVDAIKSYYLPICKTLQENTHTLVCIRPTVTLTLKTQELCLDQYCILLADIYTSLKLATAESL